MNYQLPRLPCIVKNTRIQLHSLEYELQICMCNTQYAKIEEDLHNTV